MESNPRCILIVEDDPAHAEAVRRSLESGVDSTDIRIAASLAEGRRRIAERLPDAVIADLNLADGKAFELIGDQPDTPPFPLLVMTSHGDEQMAVRALKAGALDYVVKSSETFAQMPRLVERLLREWRNISERTTAQKALRASERQLMDIIDFLPDPTFAVDRDGRVIAWNFGLERLTGCSKSQLLGQPIREHWNVFYDTPHPLLLESILDPDAQPSASYDYVRQDGDQLIAEVFSAVLNAGRGAHLWIVAAPLLNTERELSGAIESIRDISAAKQAQLELQRAYGETRAITEAVRDTLYMVDRQGRLMWWNKRIEEETGCGPDALRNRPFPDFFVEDDAEKIRKALDTAWRQGYCEVEGRARTIDGIRAYRYNGVPVRDAQGRLIGIAGVGQDISEQLRDQEDLRLAATVLKNTREGVLISDSDGTRIVAINPAFTEITGYSETEAIGGSTRMLKSGRHETAFYQAMWALIASSGHWQGEIWNRRKSGEIFPAWLTISTVRDDAGEITNYVGVLSDISQVKRSEAQLEHLAHYDPLTDLPNRLLLNSRLEHAIQRARRKHTKVAVLFIDLDRFKHVNDSLGHPVGDALLQAVAQRLAGRTRGEDTLARLGGDEFVILLESIDQSREAGRVAQLIIDLMRQPFNLAEEREIYVGASIGISIFPDNGEGVTELLRNADTAMYQSKAQGRNTYRYYTESLTRAANARLLLESKLRRALEREEFILHFQPQVAMADERILGVETLVRWQDPEEGLIPPDSFIPLAEETGLIIPLGAWVLRQACRQMRDWRAAGMPTMTLAVNLSIQQFAQRDLAVQVGAILDEYDLPASCLELELTESMIMHNDAHGIDILNAMRELGVGLAIDDFGTGYSSLGYLKRLPIDRLKIDKSFVQGIPEDRNDAEIAATIIAMAHNLKLQVLAEGVETQEQHAFLREAGCEAYQGYLFSPPVPAEKIEALLAAPFRPNGSTAEGLPAPRPRARAQGSFSPNRTPRAG
ncbi:EAL domain-containing protein [Imhoffiella purpurea]|uniref:cyclic-guanylate-specific phosphodiesterase n=1 Tax=Imhoffiella purpurea TaxID=1249627 RepID=W9VYF0_9GAMM|nr:EAL domain-containing protein [Imhoffiella purpurea]EXJ15410.1 diguanylate cyclase [Imhoffiella purpurea]